MRLALFTLALSAALPTASAQSPAQPDSRAAADAVAADVLAWRRDIHQHPELGNRETRTSQLARLGSSWMWPPWEWSGARGTSLCIQAHHLVR